jgi:hypothetical protein
MSSQGRQALLQLRVAQAGDVAVVSLYGVDGDPVATCELVESTIGELHAAGGD